MTDDDITVRDVQEADYGYRVIILTIHRQRGPVEVVVLCELQDEAIEVSRAERGKQTNQRANAIVRIDSKKRGEWHPIVQWTFVGSWRREMQ
jgi:hypothetical protein